MIFDRLFTQNKILETAMQGTELRNKVVLNNIANIDTPNYKRKDIKFEKTLENAINKTKIKGEDYMDNALNKVQITTLPNSRTLDGNSVDVESEMVALYKNSTKYDMIVNSVLNNSNMKSTVYSAFK